MPAIRRGGRYPQSSTDTNVTVIITNVGADYTSLGSFGTAETFGANLVSQMDRSFLLRSGFNRPKSVQVPLGSLLVLSPPPSCQEPGTHKQPTAPKFAG